MQLSGKDFDVLKSIQEMYSISGVPNKLFRVVARPHKGHMIVFANILNPSEKVTVNFVNTKVDRLEVFDVFSEVPINQDQINQAKNDGIDVPEPKYNWQLSVQLLDMVQKISSKEITWTNDPLTNEETLLYIMSKAFPNYDGDKFKIPHMKKVWKWALIINEHRNNLQEIEDLTKTDVKPVEETKEPDFLQATDVDTDSPKAHSPKGLIK